MENNTELIAHFGGNIVIVGFGSIGQALLPLIFRHLDVVPSQVTIISKKVDGKAEANEFGVKLIECAITKANYLTIIDQYLKAGDFLLNMSVDVSSVDLIKACQERDILYLDTCIEPWAGGYTNKSLSISHRSNYAMREAALALKKTNKSLSTAVITHGANPGLVSHFVKQALINIAKDNDLAFSLPTTQAEWALLANQLGIKVIHVAEHDTQITSVAKQKNEFVNTWSIDGFISEGFQPAELGWGSHERHMPHDGNHHEFGSRSAIYLNRPGAATKVRTWAPLAGPFHGFLITHGEAISISDYLTIKKDDEIVYRPTVHYAYHPCEDALLSLHELAGREWDQQTNQRLLFNEITDGMDELGVLLMGNKKGAYWFGSHLTIHDARKLAPYNTATSLQVSIGVLAAMMWAIEHPQCGVTEPDEIDFSYIMKIALPYLGKVDGYYTDWTPLQNREKLFSEGIDKTDPWQFINIRVM